MLQKITWCGANLGSYQQSVLALKALLDVSPAIKQIQRITSRSGAERVAEREQEIEQFQQLTLEERTRVRGEWDGDELAVVMMDGGRMQRRDHFAPRHDQPATETPTGDVSPDETGPLKETRHWREDKIGLVLRMKNARHEQDPFPEFPEFLVSAPVVAELARLSARREGTAPREAETAESDGERPPGSSRRRSRELARWRKLTPKLVSREVIASSVGREEFGWHLEWKGWLCDLPGASRGAFVADGQSANWNVHREHFSRLTPVLDLMHALSYSWKVACSLGEPELYGRFSQLIWRGQVGQVVGELAGIQQRIGLPGAETPPSDPRSRVDETLTYYRNQQSRMDYPRYRREGLPITSSHVESAIKQINLRVKGSEKFWREDHGESVLQLRADSLSDSQPLEGFWKRKRSRENGTNRYRTPA